MTHVTAADACLLRMASVGYRWPGAADECLALDELEVRQGESVFVRGPSGVGKSTLLSLAAGVLVPTRGHVALLGQPLNSLRAVARDRLRGDHIGYIFQQFNLLPYLSAIGNVLLTAQLSPLRARRAGGKHSSEAAKALLGSMGIGAAVWQRPASQLSVGQQQRVAAARALLGKPELVIADEPTSALDEGSRDTFMEVLLQRCHEAGSALLFVSHDGRLASAFDRKVDLALLNHAPFAGLAGEGSP